jgi:hypothetical protein
MTKDEGFNAELRKQLELTLQRAVDLEAPLDRQGPLSEPLLELIKLLNEFRSIARKVIFTSRLNPALNYFYQELDELEVQLREGRTANSELFAEAIRQRISRLRLYLPLFILLPFLVEIDVETGNGANEASSIKERLAVVETALTEADGIFNNLRERNELAVTAFENIAALDTQTAELARVKTSEILEGDFAGRSIVEAKTAKRWTVATWVVAGITVLALTLLVLSYAFDWIKKGDFDWGFLAAKVLLLATLGFVTRWTSKRANHHLAEEGKYHRLALNLASVRPFVSAWEKEQKEKVLSEVALKVFTESGSQTDTKYDSVSLEEISRSLLDKFLKK